MREKLIELLGKTPDIGWSDSARSMVADHLIANGVIIKSDCEDCASQTTRCIDKLQGEIAKLREVQRWIPVTERLPHPNEVVMTWSQQRSDLEVMNVLADFEMGDVTHWMPLPEPPKGE